MDMSARLHPREEVEDVLVEEPDAARRGRPADRRGVVRAMDAVIGVAPAAVEIERPRPERIFKPARHAAGERTVDFRVAPDHVLRRRPVRPFPLAPDDRVTGKAVALAPDRDAVADRPPAVENVVEHTRMRIDDDRPRRIGTGVVDLGPGVLPG